jgi:hypothetical protein
MVSNILLSSLVWNVLNLYYLNISFFITEFGQWSWFLASDPDVRVRFPALPNFLRSSGCETGSTQPREDNWGAISVRQRTLLSECFPIYLWSYHSTLKASLKKPQRKRNDVLLTRLCCLIVWFFFLQFEKNPDPYSEDHGLVFRSFMYLFELLKQRSEFHFILKASFLEIYNEKVMFIRVSYVHTVFRSNLLLCFVSGYFELDFLSQDLHPAYLSALLIWSPPAGRCLIAYYSQAAHTLLIFWNSVTMCLVFVKMWFLSHLPA